MRAALRAVDPYQAVKNALRFEGQTQHVGERAYDLVRFKRVLVVGAGKASAPLARAVEETLGDRVSAGLVNVKYGYTDNVSRIRLREAAHPVPDRSGLDGTREIVRLLEGAEADDLVLCLISGGG